MLLSVVCFFSSECVCACFCGFFVLLCVVCVFSAYLIYAGEADGHISIRSAEVMLVLCVFASECVCVCACVCF